MPEATSWWERRIVQFFMRRGPMTAAVVPLVLGLVFLYGAAMVVAIIAEHRFWTASIEVAWVLVAGAGALVITYLLALLAMGAVFTRSRYNRLLALHQTMRDIRAMSWVEFEELVAANYAAQGYEVDRVGQAGPDGGVDLRMRKGGESVLVQCKHYRNSWVHELPLRQFLGTLENFKADRGIFVSCGVFDEAAEQFAKQNPRIELVAGEQLEEMIQQSVQRKLSGRTTRALCAAHRPNRKRGRGDPSSVARTTQHARARSIGPAAPTTDIPVAGLVSIVGAYRKHALDHDREGENLYSNSAPYCELCRRRESDFQRRCNLGRV